MSCIRRNDSLLSPGSARGRHDIRGWPGSGWPARALRVAFWRRAQPSFSLLCAGLHFSFPSFVTFYTVVSHGCQPFEGVGCVPSPPAPRRSSRSPTGKIFGNREMRLLMLGLDAAGKTSAWPSLPARARPADHLAPTVQPSYTS